MNPLIEELESLIFDWEENTLDDQGIERVRQILRSSEEAQIWYVRHQQLSVAMLLDGQQGTVRLPEESTSVDNGVRGDNIDRSAPAQHTKPEKRQAASWLPFVAAALAVLIGRLAYLEFASPPLTVVDSPDATDAVEVTSHGVAIVTKLVDVDWGTQQPLSEGDALTPGQFSIDSGFAQLEFFCGATVILEGPAELNLQSPMLAQVRSGRLRAQVPPAARGFSLEVDDMKVVDLGTEFALSVSDTGASVQVFDGEVEVHSDQISDGHQKITAGNAITRKSDGEFAASDLSPSGFVDIAALESRSTGKRDARFRRWKEFSEKLQTDPRLITSYAFDQLEEWHRRLPNSQSPPNRELDGAIVGATRVTGRWPEKYGLEFKRPGDRVRVNIDGNFESLTFCAWVRIDSLDRLFNSLFLTDNYNKGEPHWQILQSGQLYFSVRPSALGEKQIRDFKAISPPFWKPSFSGRWLHLASVYDVSKQEICHYLNGDLLSRHEVPAEKIVPTRIGTASIGNWSLPTQADAGFAIRNLNGSIDEFLLFADALSADEVRQIFEHGRP